MKRVDRDPLLPKPSFTKHLTSSFDREGELFHSKGTSVSMRASRRVQMNWVSRWSSAAPLPVVVVPSVEISTQIPGVDREWHLS